MVTKHINTIDNIVNPNGNVFNPNGNAVNPNGNAINPNGNHSRVSKNCDKCNHVFKQRSKMLKHQEKCTGLVNKLECPFCHNIYASDKSKFNHVRICKVKKYIDSKALIVCHPIDEKLSSSSTNIGTNIQNINGDNIQNQTVINLVVYNSNPNETMQFNHKHIDPKKLKKFFVPGDKVQPERLTDAMREWTNQLLSNDDNKCVKKTNIRASHSQVHVGNNNWESRLDKEVYPHLMNNIANDFSDFFSENYRRNMYTALDAFIDYMASDGYCSTDSDKVIENSFKTLVKELKLRMFDSTKH